MTPNHGMKTQKAGKQTHCVGKSKSLWDAECATSRLVEFTLNVFKVRFPLNYLLVRRIVLLYAQCAVCRLLLDATPPTPSGYMCTLSVV